MAMISGPFTDTVVDMLMRSDRPRKQSALYLEEGGRFGFYDGVNIFVADPVVRRILPRDFGKAKNLIFPEKCGDGLRLSSEDGSLWVIPLNEEERAAFLCSYHPVSDGEVLARIKKAETEQRPQDFPLRCKIAFPDDGDEADLELIKKILLKYV